MGWAGPLTTSIRRLWVSGYLPRAMVERAEGRRPQNRPSDEGDDSDPGLATQRERDLTATQRGTLKPAWVLHKREGAQRPWRRGATGYCRLSRQPLVRHGQTVTCVSLFVSFVALVSMGLKFLTVPIFEVFLTDPSL